MYIYIYIYIKKRTSGRRWPLNKCNKKTLKVKLKKGPEGGGGLIKYGKHRSVIDEAQQTQPLLLPHRQLEYI